MQSACHNCPTIDGVMQSAGRQFAASNVHYRADGATTELKLDIASAYPKEANLAHWTRTLRLDGAKNEIEISDDYALTKAVRIVTLSLMTPCAVKQEPGVLVLGDAVRV